MVGLLRMYGLAEDGNDRLFSQSATVSNEGVVLTRIWGRDDYVRPRVLTTDCRYTPIPYLATEPEDGSEPYRWDGNAEYVAGVGWRFLPERSAKLIYPVVDSGVYEAVFTVPYDYGSAFVPQESETDPKVYRVICYLDLDGFRAGVGYTLTLDANGNIVSAVPLLYYRDSESETILHDGLDFDWSDYPTGTVRVEVDTQKSEVRFVNLANPLLKVIRSFQFQKDADYLVEVVCFGESVAGGNPDPAEIEPITIVSLYQPAVSYDCTLPVSLDSETANYLLVLPKTGSYVVDAITPNGTQTLQKDAITHLYPLPENTSAVRITTTEPLERVCVHCMRRVKLGALGGLQQHTLYWEHDGRLNAIPIDLSELVVGTTEEGYYDSETKTFRFVPRAPHTLAVLHARSIP